MRVGGVISLGVQWIDFARAIDVKMRVTSAGRGNQLGLARLRIGSLNRSHVSAHNLMQVVVKYPVPILKLCSLCNSAVGLTVVSGLLYFARQSA